ncbi:MAG: hypothetical protein PVH19_01170, partial [Planctomycetia bacterium]
MMIVIAIGALALPSPVAAVNIVMNFNTGSSAYPSYDTDGSKLIALMDSVEDYYEDIFEASGTLTVDFYYSNIDSLAVHNNTGTSGGHPTSCRIRVDTNRTWFFDETPFNDSEFNMTQTLAGSISSLGSYYDGTVPDLLEYAYKGSDNGTGPAESSNGFDLWSILLHEMGHGLGMTGNCAWWETVWDDDYDIDSDWVWGNSMAIDCYSSDNRYHLAARTNMYPTTPVGARRMPSATDIFAISAAGGWGDVDLMRKDFYSPGINANLNSHALWSGNWKPDSTEDAWVRHGGSARPHDEDFTVNNLYVSGGSIVRTSTYRVRADRDCFVGNSSSDTGTIHAQANGEFQVDGTLTVKDGSTVLMDATSLLDVDTLDIRDGAFLTGAGTIDIEDGFDLGGVLTVSGGDLVIDSDVPIDFDSANGAAVYVTGGDLSCNVELTDAMSTYVEVGAGHCLTMTEGWQLY